MGPEKSAAPEGTGRLNTPTLNTAGRLKWTNISTFGDEGITKQMDSKKIFIGLLTSTILFFSLWSAYAVKLDEGVYGGSGGGDWSCTPGGPKRNSECGLNMQYLPNFPTRMFDEFLYINGAIEICEPEPPIQSKINEWVLSDPALKAEVLAGSYDNSVREIFDKVFDIYWTNGAGGVSSCDSILPHMLLDGSNLHGVCIHWASAVFSLIRTLGVPADRAYIVGFGTESGGHTIAMYKSDTGSWYALDVTCCQSMVAIGGNNWFDLCSSDCTCIKGDREVISNDYGNEHWVDGSRFDGACSSVDIAYKIPYIYYITQVGDAIIDCYDSGGSDHVCELMDVSGWDENAAVFVNHVEIYRNDQGRGEIIIDWHIEQGGGPIYIDHLLGERVCIKFDDHAFGSDEVDILRESDPECP